jgi:hypothetical protein
MSRGVPNRNLACRFKEMFGRARAQVPNMAEMICFSLRSVKRKILFRSFFFGECRMCRCFDRFRERRRVRKRLTASAPRCASRSESSGSATNDGLHTGLLSCRRNSATGSQWERACVAQCPAHVWPFSSRNGVAHAETHDDSHDRFHRGVLRPWRGWTGRSFLPFEPARQPRLRLRAPSLPGPMAAVIARTHCLIDMATEDVSTPLRGLVEIVEQSIGLHR